MSSSDDIGELVKLAGRRPMPDQARMSAARVAARAEWTRLVQARSRSLFWWTLTTAAVVVLGVGYAVSHRRPQAPAPMPARIATLQRTSGTVVVIASGSRTTPEVGAQLRAGDRIETSPADRAGIALTSGVSVRLNGSSAVVLVSEDLLRLDRGTVYVDAGKGSGGSGFRVDTALGIVRHLGTQFEVSVLDGGLRVRVREGSVAVERAAARWVSHAREELLLVSGQDAARRTIAAFGPDWNWVDELPAPFQLEGASVPQFLDWASREQGLRWEYSDPAIRSRVEKVVLHGSVDKLTPREALDAVLPTCGLTSRRDAGRLIVIAAGGS